ncbi:MAG TPA: histidine phosphatase family protein [Candidatus Limnocylindrales bacterium]|nr:histidine phosphatase family protein [Candidatus Limnocylindrales bacterium]
MLTLVLTRHGLTDRSEPEQHLGQHIDISLSDAGRRQAEALSRRLAGVRFERVISSPLFRAQETAEMLSRGGIRIETDPRLKEMDYGGWEGLTYEQIADRDGAARREWELAPDRLACPGGESGEDVARRVRSFLDDLLAEHKAWHARASFRAATSFGGPGGVPAGRSVLAVAHSSTNRVLMCLALGTDIRDYRKRFVQAQANLTVLRWEAGDGPADAKLLVANDLGHLRAAGELPWS